MTIQRFGGKSMVAKQSSNGDSLAVISVDLNVGFLPTECGSLQCSATKMKFGSEVSVF